MIYLKSFIFVGSICFMCQIILDKYKVTPGHITSIVTIIGAFLSFLGIYDKLINIFGVGAKILISNFGHSLYQSGLEEYYKSGILGIFLNLLKGPSLAITSVLFFSFIFTVIFKSKD